MRSTFSVPLEKIKIRNTKIEEVTKIAEIERICFPAAEAAGEAEFRERMGAFLENFFVADSTHGGAKWYDMQQWFE